MVVHELTHECGAPGPHLPHDQEVVARQSHAQAKTRRRLGRTAKDKARREVQGLGVLVELTALDAGPDGQRVHVQIFHRVGIQLSLREMRFRSI
mgnify:CR=1 FL=1